MSKQQQRNQPKNPKPKQGKGKARSERSNNFLLDFISHLQPKAAENALTRSPEAWSQTLVNSMINAFQQQNSMSVPSAPVSGNSTVNPSVSAPAVNSSNGVNTSSNVTPSVDSPSVENISPESPTTAPTTQSVTAPTLPSQTEVPGPNTGPNVETPTIETPTTGPGPSSGPQTVTGPNSPPEITSVWTRSTEVMFDETVDVYFNASDPDWDPLSWNYDISGSHTISGTDAGPTPWIKVSVDIPQSGMIAGDQFDVAASVFDPHGASDTDSVSIDVIGEQIAVWEVLFDTESVNDVGTNTPTRIDPLIFDLNMDGQLDITGSNQEGNGTLDGDTVLFDMDPSQQGTSGWQLSSPGHRPGYYEGGSNSRAPGVPNGTAIYDTGKQESTNKAGLGQWFEDRSMGESADIFDDKGALVGQWRQDAWGESHGGRIGQYFWEPLSDGEHRERTEWIKGTGDGFLVWDHNGNGIIDDNTEMMSEFDIEGNKTFSNGFEKLAHYFDHDNDGIIRGSELDGLKFWVDDGDAITEEGELQSLDKYGITQINIPGEGSLQSEATVGKVNENQNS